MKKLIKYLIIILIIVFGSGIVTYYFYPGTFINAATEVSKWRGNLDTKSVQVDKHLWPYIEGGAQNTETIVFIHGFGSSKEPWIPMISYFSKKYHVIAPDLPGFAKNKIVDGATYTIPAQADRLDKFMTAINVDKFHLIGVSMGGYISSYYASVFQERSLSLALIDSAGVTSPEQSYYAKHFNKTNENVLVPEDVKGYKRMLEFVFHTPPKIPDHIAGYIIEVRKKRLKEEKLLFQYIVKSMELPLEQRLPLIETKTLIMWGDKDRIIDISSVPIFEKGIKNHQTVIFKDIGHVPFLEAPIKTNEAYEKFLTGL
ncbi:MAG: alpha/beta hydrolase [Desulfobacterales bacterium]|jgi:abhydrolase domain-containing protein 6|nr:alpha/beta hydrolase [Desulfobacteraceae bacterium]MBT7085357.1 alpha/beta hydrolase [Desulfobacterales bacterium]